MDINLDGILGKKYISSKDLYQDLVDSVVVATDSEIGYLHHFDENTQELTFDIWCKHILETCTVAFPMTKLLCDADIWADSIRQKRLVIQNNYQQYALNKSLPIGHLNIDTHMGFPLYNDKSIVGMFGLANGHKYTENVAKEIQNLINDTWSNLADKSTAIDNDFATLDVEFNHQTNHDVLINLVCAISKSLEIKDQYTHQHQQNVAFIAEQIAAKLGFSKARIVGLRLGALLHDIGKMSLPSEILNKPGNLLPEELALLKTHASTGESIFQDTHFPWPIRDMISQHHERIDGSGYPLGLKSNQIILEAKIIAVADIYDAMANDRPYRKSLGRAKAIQMLKDCRMSQLDPYVVDAFMVCIEEDPTFLGRYKID